MEDADIAGAAGIVEAAVEDADIAGAAVEDADIAGAAGIVEAAVEDAAEENKVEDLAEDLDSATLEMYWLIQDNGPINKNQLIAQIQGKNDYCI